MATLNLAEFRALLDAIAKGNPESQETKDALAKFEVEVTANTKALADNATGDAALATQVDTLNIALMELANKLANSAPIPPIA